MASPTVAALKLRHASNHAPFELGFFGNSRVLMIGASAIERTPGQFFNFALSSESLSGSVMLVKHLATMNRLPKTIVLGLDNLHLQRDNVPIWPALRARVKYAWKRLQRAIYDGAPITAARRTWRFFWGEAARFDSIFGPTLVQAGAARMIKNTTPPTAASGTGGYRIDGSQAHTARAPNTPQIERTTSRLDLALFRQNIEELGAVAARGHDIIIVETPLHPDSQRRLETSIPTYVQKSRNLWHEVCKANGLHCVDAPLIADDPNDPWYDPTHAPAKPWAAFIVKSISRVTAGIQN